MPSAVMPNSTIDTPLIFDGDCAFYPTPVRWLERMLAAMPATMPRRSVDLDSRGLGTACAADR